MVDNNQKSSDPGWNDPPMLNYDKSNPPPKSRIGNKRLAFPLSNTSGSPSLPMTSTSPLNLPPQTHKTPIPPLCDDNLYKTVENSLLKNLVSVNKDKVKEDMEKLLQTWKEGQLSKSVQTILFDLFQHLDRGEKLKAEECLSKISNECVNECHMWIDSLQYLIQIRK